MFPYRVKYTESESDILNNDLLYQLDQQCQTTFFSFEEKSTSSNSFKHINILLGILYKFHNTCFVYFVYFTILGMLDFCICLLENCIYI